MHAFAQSILEDQIVSTKLSAMSRQTYKEVGSYNALTRQEKCGLYYLNKAQGITEGL